MTQWNDGELQFVYPTDEFVGVDGELATRVPSLDDE